MVALNFPTPTAVGQIYTAGVSSWQWDGTAWNIVPLITPPIADDDAPANPYAGQLWWNALNGNLYVWYVDANSAQWVQTAGNTGAAYKTAETRNRVVNPAMTVGQENGDTASTATQYYMADQWQTYWQSAVGQAGGGRVQLNTPNGSRYALHQYVNVADTALATEWLGCFQPIEGLDISDFQWGTANAKPAVLRFWATTSAPGTYGGGIRSVSPGPSRTFVFAFTLPLNVWTEVVIAIPPETGGTAWTSNATKAAELWFTWATGPTGSGTPGEWQAGSMFGATGQSNGFGVVNNHFYVADVGLYRDPENTGKAPPFQVLGYAEELIRCHRYYEAGDTRLDAYGAASTFHSQTIPFKVTKRAAPVVAVTAGAISNMTGNNSDMATPFSFRHYRQFVASGGGAWSANWTANARM